jgi:predicted DNA-binding ribbon-helix-helix protein
MKSTVVKRSIVIAGHKTSVSLEEEFWSGLKVIAGEHDMKLWELVTSIDSHRRYSNLSSAIRLFVLDHYQRMAKHNNQQPLLARLSKRGRAGPQ